MATSEIQTKIDARATFACTIASLAPGVAQQSTLLLNTNKRPGAVVSVSIRSGAAAPAAGGTYDVFLIRDDGTVATDNAGAVDAAITIENAEPLGSIVVTNTADKVFSKEFDTMVAGVLGPKWGIAIRNNTDQAIKATGHQVGYSYYVPEAQ